MSENYILNTAAFHITYACTHFCPMCYAGEIDREPVQREHPGYEKVSRVIKNLNDNGIKNISFVGGDPAEYPFILEASQYAASLGCDLSILSNTLEFGTNAYLIANYIDAFEGTIHDETEESHDDFCKKLGAYSLLTKNMRLFSDLGKRIGVTINLTPFTYNKVLKMVENVICRGINVNYVVLQRIIPFGRATDSKEYQLDIQQLEIALRGIMEIEKMGISIVFEDPFPMCSVRECYRKYMHPCEWGLTKVSVDYEGNLSRCGADPRCTLGNIFDKPLRETWKMSKELCLFREKKYLPDKCQNCNLLDNCGGACPISKTTNSFYSEDYMSV